MSSEENLQSVNNKRPNDQVVNTWSIGDSQDVLSKIINELCDLYIKEVMKGNSEYSILHTINHYLANRQQIPEEIINLCLNNQENPIIKYNPIIQNILACCYSYGKWIKKDENQVFFHYKKSAEMNDSIGINGLGRCYENGIGVEKKQS
ncbi:hypothetical protein C2G38_2142092 [Gigaspora rosea]|uniref:Uncharacterized protein n=1 Tax=Gigaspora rosea TaxID=44941 RepID=A0A397V7J6_9GLOM|nr:hypothetical protein C2G38_2142092 [Gigaspora rosea]